MIKFFLKILNIKLEHVGVPKIKNPSGLAVSYATTMFGLSSLERHITLDRSIYGSDQSASLELKGMRELTSVINKMIAAMGVVKTGHVLEEEIPIAKKLRAHLSLDNG